MKQQRFWNSILFVGALAVCALLSALMLPLITGERSAWFVCIPATLIYAFGAVLVFFGSRRGVGKLEPLWAAAVLTALGLTLLMRLALLPSVSDDFLEYLSVWLEQIRALPDFSAFTADIGNYNMPYFYLLFLLGKSLPQSADLYVIKCVSILFDYVLAYFVMKLVMLKTEKQSIAIASFALALLVPTVILNGAMWAQCDSLYAAFALGGLYYGLRGKSRLCWSFFAIAFSIKLQTVFLLPILLVLLFTERIRLRDVWIFFAVFLLTLVPAMCAGRSFIDCVSIYVRQAGTYSELCMLAPSAYAWFPEGTRSNIPVIAAGILLALGVTLCFVLYLFRRRNQLDDTAMIEAAFLFTLMIPFLLPLMHERYFFLADAMAAVYLFWRPKRWYVSALVCLSSLLAYISYLFDGTTVPLWLLAFFMLGAIVLVLRDFGPRVEARKGIRSLQTSMDFKSMKGGDDR